MASRIIVLVLFGVAGLAGACASSQPPAPPATTTDASSASAPASMAGYAQVQAVFDAKCTQCHSGADAAQGLQLGAWDHVVAGSEHANVVTPFDANHSLLIQMVTQLVGGPHPAEVGGETLTEDEVDVIRTWIEDGAINEAGAVPYADADNLIYVNSQGSAFISIIDLNTKRVVRTVDLQELGFSANAKPHHVVVEPDGSYWYVSLIGEGKVLKFNRDNELVGQTDIFETPGMMVLHPTKNYLYVGRSMTAVNPPHRIGIIDRSDMSLEEVDVFYPRPHALALTPDGEYIFSASLAENNIGVVNTETEEVALTPVEGPVHTLVQFALSPDGNTLAITGQLSDKLLIFDSSEPTNLKLIGSVDVDSQPFHPVFGKDGRYVYFGSYNANTISVVDVQEQSVVKVIEGPGIAEPHDAAISADGRYVFITSSNMEMSYHPRYNFGSNHMDGTLVILDTQTNTIDEVVELGAMPTGIGVPSQ